MMWLPGAEQRVPLPRPDLLGLAKSTLDDRPIDGRAQNPSELAVHFVDAISGWPVSSSAPTSSPSPPRSPCGHHGHQFWADGDGGCAGPSSRSSLRMRLALGDVHGRDRECTAHHWSDERRQSPPTSPRRRRREILPAGLRSAHVPPRALPWSGRPGSAARRGSTSINLGASS